MKDFLYNELAGLNGESLKQNTKEEGHILEGR